MISIRLRLTVGLKGVSAVLTRPAYTTLALVTTLIVLGIFVWAFNLDLLRFVLFDSGLGVIDKLIFIARGYESLTTNFTHGTGLVFVLFSLLAGINAALIAFLIRSKVALTEKGKGVGATIAAVIGAGCAACGTSILAPLLTAAGATSTIALSEVIGILANMVGIGLMAYSIIGLGIQAATVAAQELSN